MSNEYLHNVPSSTGNRKVWTWSGWIKRNLLDGVRQGIFTAVNNAGSIFSGIEFTADDKILWYEDQIPVGAQINLTTERQFRDVGSWMHLVIVFNSTASNAEDRAKLYVNGSIVDKYSTDNRSSITRDLLSRADDISYRMVNGGWGVANANISLKGEIMDLFHIDGLELTPDVFGFYKDGDGHISVGSTVSTDFRPGQWVPKSPSVIRDVINNSGGFGVNGFYLPMNDSSNPGADFHCDPNTIIKLKGEDIPQPQNGAPETSDFYVSQLRSDPHAANLVLAVPGISTSTTNLVSNGDFSNGTTDWTISDASEGSMQVNGNQQLVLTNSNGSDPPVYAWQKLSGIISGKTYTLQGDLVGGTSSNHAIYVNDANAVGSTYGFIASNNGNGSYSNVFTTTGTDVYIICRVNANTNAATSIFDNVIVREENLTDYSANIRGSGSNITLTPVGGSGSTGNLVGIEYLVPSYYGSAMSFEGSANGPSAVSEVTTDLELGSGDFTIEAWVNYAAGIGADTPLSMDDGTNTYALLFGYLSFTGGDPLLYMSSTGTSWDITGNGGLSFGANINENQWTHLAVVREGTNLSVYRDGKCSNYLTNLGTKTIYQGSNQISLGRVQSTNYFDGYIQDLRIYKGLAKYKGGFDVSKPYIPVGIEAFRTTDDTCKNNFATLNPLVKSEFSSGDRSISDGNLTATTISTGSGSNLLSTIGVSSGKWYIEVYVKDVTAEVVGFLGVTGIGQIDNQNSDTSGGDHIYYYGPGTTYDYVAGTLTINNYGSSYTEGDIISVLINADNGEVTFYKNNVSQGVAKTFPTSQFPLLLHLADGASGATCTYNVNFGQNPTFSDQLTAGTNADGNGKGLFKYAPPSGFLALCEDNLPTPAIAEPGEQFKCVLYTGSGGNKAITGVGFKPDLVWIKNRDQGGTDSYSHNLYDVIRPMGSLLSSNETSAEISYAGFGPSSFDNDGFSLIGNGSLSNSSDKNYVAWCWKAGGDAVSNTDGTITSQVSANQTAGFSIISLNTGSGGNFTVGHGLANAPKFFIAKSRNQTFSWTIYHHSMGNDKYIYLNSTAASVTSTSVWQNTAPSSSVIYGNSANWGTADYIIYAWTEVEGYSRFGSYEGNNSADGPFIYCGFKPAWIMFKNIDALTNWVIVDSSRDSGNTAYNDILFPDGNFEANTGSNKYLDFVSNGFKLRGTSNAVNAAETYVFMAFAESPFQTANAK